MCLQVDFLFRVSGKSLAFFQLSMLKLKPHILVLLCTFFSVSLLMGKFFLLFCQFHWLVLYFEINGEKK